MDRRKIKSKSDIMYAELNYTMKRLFEKETEKWLNAKCDEINQDVWKKDLKSL